MDSIRPQHHLHFHLYVWSGGLLSIVLCYFLMPSFGRAMDQMISLLYFEDIIGLRMLIVSYQSMDWLISILLTVLQTIIFPFAQVSIADANVAVFPFFHGTLLSIIGYILGAGMWFWISRWIRRFISLYFIAGKLGEFEGWLQRLYPWMIILLSAVWFIPFSILGLFFGLMSISFRKFTLCFVGGLLLHFVYRYML